MANEFKRRADFLKFARNGAIAGITHGRRETGV
jgi:hypothetical protein